MTETLSGNFNDNWVDEGIVASQGAAYYPGRSTAQDPPRPRNSSSTPTPSTPIPSTPTPSTRTTILDTDTVMKILDTYSVIRTAMDQTPNPSAKLRADFQTAVDLFSELIFQYDKLSPESRTLVDMFTEVLLHRA